MDLNFGGREMCVGWPRIHVPDACKGVEVVIGIDEAGRGSVLGSLIYSAAFWPKSEHDAISKLGFDDSKQLKEGERDGLAARIKAHGSIGWVIAELPPDLISTEMLKRSPTSLNALSYRAVVWMLEQIKDYPINPPIIRDLFIDTVGDPETYKSFLQRNITTHNQDPRDWNYTIEKKADATYRVVGAASIVAKTMRDMSITEWEYPETVGPGAVGSIDKEFGSGYPGDPKCVEWLNRHMHPVFGYPSVVRFSWSTTRDILKENKDKLGIATVKWEADDEDSGGVPSITSFFGGGGDKTTKRSAYFISKHMKHVMPGAFD
jgi:ribonuclease H2 subunit A